jgi:RNA polymerase sigma factor (sigma-70 family)
VQRCIDRSAGAWEELLRRYAELIYSTIIRVEVPPDDREDAFQSTVLAICSSLERLRHRESIVSWIVGIAYRQAVLRIRARIKERGVPMLPESIGDGGSPGELPDDSEPPDALRLQLEESQQLKEALERLPERCRRLIRLLFFEEPTPDYVEIARREAIPIGSIGPTRARCIDRLRRIAVDQGWDV